MKHLIAPLALLSLSACTIANSDNAANYYLQRKNIPAPTQETVTHCRGYGCLYIDQVTLSNAEWTEISTTLATPSSAIQERAAIRDVIGKFERIIGAHTGTSGDIHGSFYKTGHYQLDCVDESTNTTIYLLALKKRGLLKYHVIEGPNTRLPLIHGGRWPHQTAVIRDTKTGERFAVDSWFHDNAHPAEIVTLKAWKNGWRPTETLRN